MNEEELARLVVRLVGDTESYQQMFTAAAEKAGEMERASRKLGAAEKATAEAIRMGAEVTRQAESASEKYARQAREVKSLLDQQAISQTTANRTMKQARKAYFEAGNAATQYGRSIMSAGRAGMFRVTAPIVGIGVAAVAAGSSIETAFAGVRKTVNASEEQLQGLKSEFEDFITQGNAPFDMTELLGAAETAGQLGIKFENIVGFSKTVKNLELATNLGDAAGESLARIANITGLPQTQFENLGSTIVALGNNSAATESDIVDMTLRLGAAGRIIGLTVPQTTAFAASLASVGINAEAGGTAFSKLFVDMARQVATGGKNLDAFAKTAGMSVDEFSEKFRVDAAGAVKALMTGLSQLDGAGAIQAMDAMGISEQRMTDAILRSAGAVDLMTDSMKLADRAFAENTALAAEAEVRYNSFAGIVKNTWAQLKLLGEEIFQTIRPALISVMNTITDAIAAFNGLDDSTKGFLIAVAAVAAAIPPLLIGLGGLVHAGGMAAIAYATLTTASGGLAISTIALNGVLAAAPYAAVAIAVAALVGTVGALALAHADLNEQLAESGRLNDKLIADSTKRVEATIETAKMQSDEGKSGIAKTTIAVELEDAKARVESFRKQVLSAAKDVKDNSWNIIDRASLNVARKELEESQARMRAAQGDVERLRGAMSQIDQASETGMQFNQPGTPTAAATAASVVDAVPQSVLDGVEALDASLQDQINTFGMTQREVDIYRLKLEGATDDTLKFVTAMSDGLARMESNRAFEDKMKSIQQGIDSIGLSGVDLEIFNLGNLGMTIEQLDQIRPKLEEFQAKSEAFKESEKQKADADKLIEQYLPLKAKFAKRQAELQAMLDKGLIDKSTYESAVKDAEKQLMGLEDQTKKDYSVDVSVKGIDAVESDSAEAMARVREYFATRIPRPDVPSIPGLPADSPAPQAPPTPQAAVAAGEITAPSMPPLDTLLFDEAKIKQQIENIEATMAKTDSAFRLVRLEESLDIAKGKAAELRAIIDGIGGSADVSVAGGVSQPTQSISDISSNGTFFGLKPGQGLPAAKSMPDIPGQPRLPRTTREQTIAESQAQKLDGRIANVRASIAGTDSEFRKNRLAESLENLIARQSDLRQSPSPSTASQSVQSNEPTPQERAETANSNRITPATDRDREPLLRVAVATEQLLALQQNRPLIELQPSGLER